MTTLRISFLTGTAMLSVILTPWAAAQDVKPAFSVSISAPLTEVADARKLELQITLTNISDHAIEFDEDGAMGDSNFLIEVFDSKGNPAPETPGSHVVITYDSFQRDLNPGEKHTYPVYNLCRLYNLQPGKYTITAAGYDFQLRPEQGPNEMGLQYQIWQSKHPNSPQSKPSIPVKSNALTFSITTNACSYPPLQAAPPVAK